MAGIIFHLRLEGKKGIRLSSFSVADPFLTTCYYVEKRIGILRKNRGEGFEKSYVPLHGGRVEVKNCQNLPYVINEWPQTDLIEAGLLWKSHLSNYMGK